MLTIFGGKVQIFEQPVTQMRHFLVIFQEFCLLSLQIV